MCSSGFSAWKNHRPSTIIKRRNNNRKNVTLAFVIRFLFRWNEKSCSMNLCVCEQRRPTTNRTTRKPPNKISKGRPCLVLWKKKKTWVSWTCGAKGPWKPSAGCKRLRRPPPPFTEIVPDFLFCRMSMTKKLSTFSWPLGNFVLRPNPCNLTGWPIGGLQKAWPVFVPLFFVVYWPPIKFGHRCRPGKQKTWCAVIKKNPAILSRPKKSFQLKTKVTPL